MWNQASPNRQYSTTGGCSIISVSESEDEATYLRHTYEKLGALSPVLRAQSGQVIDGFHRLQVDPAWFNLVLHDINDPVKVAMARLVINVCRRQVPAEEKMQLLSEIAKLTGWTPQQIAEATGMSYQWVMKYLPGEFKEKTWQRETAIPQRRIEHADVKSTRPVDLEKAEYLPEAPGILKPEPRAGFEPAGRHPSLPTAAEPEPASARAEKAEEFHVGDFKCPHCGFTALIFHVEPNKHKFQEAREP